MDYAEFFKRCTGFLPYPYQARVAEVAWPDVVDIPTGLGKTAAIVVAWLWRRLQGDDKTPRRLVYTLPMRTLVRQTRQEACGWIDRSRGLFEAKGLTPPTAHLLMGGELDERWQEFPEQPAILIGTQDMLLSRALNRGFAMSRYRWPMHFGLLNNDALWIFDETQLMGVAIETSAQIQAFREKLGVMSDVRTIWMSATVGQRQLETVDHPKTASGWQQLALAPDDLDHSNVRVRVEAGKALARLNITITTTAKRESDIVAKAIADVVREEHVADSLTLVIINRVDRAKTVYHELKKAHPAEKLALVHSRFRPPDRAKHEDVLVAKGDRIVVATQAVEAGVDVSARTLITELAPWPSFVQRVGRCNRAGEYGDARVFWIDIDTRNEKDAKGVALPYQPGELDAARLLLTTLDDCGPATLREVDYTQPPVIRPVIRRKDLLELFDTTPDLSGDDLDVSRWVRDGEDRDVSVFWRTIQVDEGNKKYAVTPEGAMPTRDELCRVSVGDFAKFLKAAIKKRKDDKPLASIYTWDHLDGKWILVDRAIPCRTYWLSPQVGGYDVDLGWTGVDVLKGGTFIPEVGDINNRARPDDEDISADPLTATGHWIRLQDHLGDVTREANILFDNLDLEEKDRKAVLTAARWHDVGKSHSAFQDRLILPTAVKPELAPPNTKDVWAKSSHRLKAKGDRKYFRHELASALAWLQLSEESPNKDLIAFLIAGHHGKVRMSIRSLPKETRPKDDRLFARGVWHHDRLQRFTLADGTTHEELKLDLGVMQIGTGSWLSRMLKLRDDANLGPFRLGYFEALMRVADWRGSRTEEKELIDACE